MKREKRALGENFKKSPRSKTVTDIIENFTLIFLEKSPWSQKTKLDLDKNVSRDHQKEHPNHKTITLNLKKASPRSIFEK